MKSILTTSTWHLLEIFQGRHSLEPWKGLQLSIQHVPFATRQSQPLEGTMVVEGDSDLQAPPLPPGPAAPLHLGLTSSPESA